MKVSIQPSIKNTFFKWNKKLNNCTIFSLFSLSQIIGKAYNEIEGNHL